MGILHGGTGYEDIVHSDQIEGSVRVKLNQVTMNLSEPCLGVQAGTKHNKVILQQPTPSIRSVIE